MDTLWQARFADSPDEVAQRYTASIDWDKNLATQDIRYSRAHSKALGKAGILDHDEVDALDRALTRVHEELEAGTLSLDAQLEDIHTVIEKRVTEIAGATGAKLHTARSRNDQVVTVMRLFVLETLDEAAAALRVLQRSVVDQATRHTTTVVPAYSHMRRAQPIRLAHHLLAYFWMFQRDHERIADARRRAALSPAGAAACAGTGIPIDRSLIAAELGFDGITANSLDTVGDRDFVLEFLSAATICTGHCSRLAADLCLWSGPEYRFVDLPEAYCTGSSMMPQKVNPDTLELVRAKVPSVAADLMALVGVMHALPLGYQRDLQEDKRPLFHGAGVLLSTLELLGRIVEHCVFIEETMRRAAEDPGLLAADWAEELVGTGVPFRDAYAAVGRLMRKCGEENLDPRTIPASDMAALHPGLPTAVAAVPDAAAAIDRKVTAGSPGPGPLARQLADARSLIG